MTYKTHLGGIFNRKTRMSFSNKLFIVFATIILLQTSYLFLILNDLDEILSNVAHDPHPSQKKRMQSLRYDPLSHILYNTVSLWNERNFLVVFGVPSLDIPMRRWRRHMQRTTCWKFSGVATRHNNYTGAMLVLYLLGRHPLNNFVLSDAVVQEANQWNDILASPMNEGLSDTNKIKDGRGLWGYEAEIGTSRKTFIWFQMALLMFPRVPYLAKGDDDIFLRVPQYLADLRRLSIKHVYWGREGWKRGLKNRNRDRTKPFMFMFGNCYTMSRDIAENFISYKPLMKTVWVPFKKERLHEFNFLNMENEDIMVGRVIYETKCTTNYVREPKDRFHSNHTLPVTDAIVVTHTPTEKEYHIFMNYFTLNDTTTQETVIYKKSSSVYKMQSPKKQRILVKRY